MTEIQIVDKYRAFISAIPTVIFTVMSILVGYTFIIVEVLIFYVSVYCVLLIIEVMYRLYRIEKYRVYRVEKHVEHD